MPDTEQIREGLKARLATIPGTQVSAYMLSNPTPPAIEIQPADIEYDQAMARGLDREEYIVRAFVGVSTDRGAQRRLDRMRSPTGAHSVKAAIEADPTLGGVVDDAHVTRCSGYRIFQREGQPAVLGAEWTVSVLGDASA